jgi:hypothetical protein
VDLALALMENPVGRAGYDIRVPITDKLAIQLKVACAITSRAISM